MKSNVTIEIFTLLTSSAKNLATLCTLTAYLNQNLGTSKKGANLKSV